VKDTGGVTEVRLFSRLIVNVCEVVLESYDDTDDTDGEFLAIESVVFIKSLAIMILDNLAEDAAEKVEEVPSC
jgi:hypothetical protein